MNAENQKKRELSSHIESKWIHHGKIISVKTDTIFESEAHQFDIVIHPGAVVILPINEEGKLIFVRQWRRAPQKILIELPAGTLEKGESPLECADRELQEEIGFRAKKITPYGGFFTAPGFCNEYLHLFLAENLEKSAKIGEDTHLIDPLTLSLEEALEKIRNGEIEDAKTLIGIYQYALTKNF